jgi:hypothetical protein
VQSDFFMRGNYEMRTRYPQGLPWLRFGSGES